MATAKQIAWRKKFGAMAAAGKFAKSANNARRVVASPRSKAKPSGYEAVDYKPGTVPSRKRNPLPILYKVQSRSGDGRAWTTIIRTTFEKDAIKAARALHDANPNRAYRVIDTER